MELTPEIAAGLRRRRKRRLMLAVWIAFPLAFVLIVLTNSAPRGSAILPLIQFVGFVTSVGILFAVIGMSCPRCGMPFHAGRRPLPFPRLKQPAGVSADHFRFHPLTRQCLSCQLPLW